MSRIVNPVAVVVVKNNEDIHGCTISSLVSVDLDEKLILFVLKDNSATGEALVKQDTFEIIVLGSNQTELAILFSSKGKALTHELLQGIEQDFLSKLHCILMNVIPNKSTNIFFAKISNIEMNSTNLPLAYFERNFGTFKKF